MKCPLNIGVSDPCQDTVVVLFELVLLAEIGFRVVSEGIPSTNSV